MSNPTPTANGIRPFLVIFVVAGLIAGALLFLPPNVQKIAFAGIVVLSFGAVLLRRMPAIDLSPAGIKAFHQSHPLAYAWVSLVIAIIFISLATFFYLPQYYDETFLGFNFFLLSLPFIRLSFPLFPIPVAHADTDISSEQDIVRWHALLISLVNIALLMLINMPEDNMLDIQLMLGFHQSPTWVQMIILGISLLGMVHGFGGRLFPRRIRLRWYHGLLILIVLLGGAIRAWDLEYTLHLFIDEFFFMRDINQIRTSPSPLLLQVFAPTTDIFAFFQTIFVELLGPSLTSLRIVSPIISMGAIVAVYSLAQHLFSIRVALIASLLFATLPVHVQFGRIGMNMIVDPIFGMLGFMYILHGMRSRRLSDYAMAGICFGLTHYFYEGGRLFFTAFLLCWFIYIAIFSRRDPLFCLPTRQQIGAFLFCLIVLMIPIYHAQNQFEISMTRRLDATRSPSFLMTDRISEFLLSSEVGHLGTPLHRYVFTIAEDNFYQSDFAYVLPVLTPSFLLGFGVLLWRIHTLRGSLFIWWALGVAIGNTVITDLLSAPSPRHIVVYGVLMIIASVGIHSLWTVLSKGRWRWIIHVLFGGYLVFVSIYHIDHYFNHTVPKFYDHVYETILDTTRPRPAFDDMIFRAIELPPNTSVQVLTDTLFPVTHETVVPEFYQVADALNVDYRFIRDLSEEYFIPLPRDVNYIFTFTRYHQEEVLDILSEYFVITEITGSPFDLPNNIEMLFAHAPLSANPIPEAVDLPFERAPDAKP